MPKCPKCNMLFTVDETLCSNCETELIEFDSSALVVFKEVDKKPQAHKFVKFLHYSNIASAVYEYNEECETWSILVKESDLKQTKKLYEAFYTVEAENALNHSKQAVAIQSTDSMEHDTKVNDFPENVTTENNSVDGDIRESSSVENDSLENDSVESSSVENNSSENDSAENSSENHSVENSSVEISANDSVECSSAENDSSENDSAEASSVENSLENNSVESSSVENSSVENSSVENSSVENSTENNSVECSPAENDSSEYDSAETSSVESSSVENDSSEYDSIESSSVESNSVENDSVENDSVENDSVENSVENNSTETDSEEYPPKEKDSPEKETLVHDVLLDTDEASELNESENNRTHNEEYPENSNTEHSPIYNPEDAEITTPEEENHLREDFNISDMEKEEEYLFDQEEIQDFYDEDPRRPEKTQTYIKKEEQYKDLISSAFSFLVISILGILILVINAIGFISIFNGTMTYIVMGGLFLIFLYIGITTLIKSNKVKGQISEENQVTDAINLWLSQNITKESLNELVNPKDTEEIQFMQKIEKMKELVIKQFGELDDLYLDRITEEYYNNHFDE